MKRRPDVALTICLVLAVELALSACAKQELVSRGADRSDAYDLISVNGKDVPASISHDGVTLQVLSGKFIIHADGTCLSKTVFVPPSGSEITREVAATYTRDGSRLTMQWEGAGTTVGTIEGETFTMDNEGMVLTYRK